MGYWAEALKSLGRHLLDDVRQREPTFTKQLLSAGLATDARPRCEEIHLLEAYPGVRDLEVDLGTVRYTGSNINPYERFCLHALAELRGARRFFEFGTFDGGTTQVLARTSPEAQVFTIDLGDAELATQPAVLASEADHVRTGGVGARWRETPEAARITQLVGDSLTYDFGPLHGQFDLVFVDACHDYDYVRSDSDNALRLVRPGGLIFWHDYLPGWPGVVRAVDELGERRPVRHVGGTSLALLDLALAPW